MSLPFPRHAFAPIGANGMSPGGPWPAMLPLRRWPPYACVALALVLLTIGIADRLGPFWWWPPVWLGSWFAADVYVALWLRRFHRKHRFVRCKACDRHTLDLAFEVLGWCLACGAHGRPQLPPEPGAAGSRAPGRSDRS